MIGCGRATLPSRFLAPSIGVDVETAGGAIPRFFLRESELKTIRARKSFPYDGNQLGVGDRFVASDRDAMLLIATGQAEDVPPDDIEDDDNEEPDIYSTVAMKRARGQRGPDKKPRKKRGTYLRRDMRAEE